MNGHTEGDNGHKQHPERSDTMYDLKLHIEATTPEDLLATLHRIAYHIENDHDLTGPGELVNTLTAGAGGRPSWSVRVQHETESVDA